MPLIKPYNPVWKKQFEQIQTILQNVLMDNILKIEHVGSTSVIDLAAKAIIDIDIVYDSPEDFKAINNQLEQLGYYHNGDQGVPKREAFKRKKEIQPHPILDNISHHLYACPKDSLELKRHLKFRDFLRQHEWARIEYTTLKKEIARQTNQDKESYSLLKETMANSFINSILEKK